ncbi:MAG TPA: hypothetical protein VMU28_04730 [Terriglobales bacterium]|nr:hypothetical protein [Terriglobales bacterium]
MALLAASLALPVVAADRDGSVPAGFSTSQPLQLDLPVPRPQMSPQIALLQYQVHAQRQAAELGSTEDTTTITAELPDAAKRGRYRLKRIYSAPKTLAFKVIDFAGDGFVKSNVMNRLLQSEADQVKKDQPALTAVTPANYRFSFKTTQTMNGRLVHVYQVKPREKRDGLFKGRIYIDAYSGTMLRAEGRLVKSPSVFIKKVEFTQDYAQVGDFNLVSHIHSVTDTRIIGRAIVDINHDDYRVKTVDQLQATAAISQTRGF